MKNLGTNLGTIGAISRIITSIIDRRIGDRTDSPLLVSLACQHALKLCNINSHVFYGRAAWIEILENETPVWSGCWEDNPHFWVLTEFDELVDLTVSVAYKKRSPLNPSIKAVRSAPMIWSNEIPHFYMYEPDGIAEANPEDEQEIKLLEQVYNQISEALLALQPINDDDQKFPDEPLLCSDRKILDDSNESFKHFERALGVHGIPKAPFEITAEEHNHEHGCCGDNHTH